MLLSTYAVPLIMTFLVFIAICRRYAVHFVVYAIAVHLTWLLMNLGPGSFVHWFSDLRSVDPAVRRREAPLP